MTKAELIDAVAGDAGLTKKEAEAALSSIFDSISNAVAKSGSFSLVGFGTFKLTKRKARKGRNPRTGETIKIKASKSVSFKPSSKLKEIL